jgi:hypothetical protein
MKPPPTTDVERAFAAEVAKLVAAQPGIEARFATVDSEWDALHHLLSEKRRNARGDCVDSCESIDMRTAAIRGEAPVGAYARATQGVALRFTPPKTVAAIARHFATMARRELFTHLDDAKMESVGVYKLFADRLDDGARVHRCTCFEARLSADPPRPKPSARYRTSS